MCSYSSKLIASIAALAAAGLLTCAAAMLDAIMPKGSPTAFLASTALVGLAVTGVAIGYIWACDKCDSYFHGRLDRLLSKGQPEKSRRVPMQKQIEQGNLQFGYRP
jgi:hypothetical protein